MTKSKSLQMSRRRAIFLLGGAAGTMIGISPSEVLANGQEILRAVDRYRAPADAFAFDILVSDSKNRDIDLTVRVRDRTKGLVLYTAPASFAGRAILYVGSNMWVYVPGTRRALRISPLQQVLGAVASADVARTVFSEDYDVTDMTQSNEQTTLELRGSGRGSPYGRITLKINSRDFRPLEAQFYSANGSRRLKTLRFDDYRQVLGMPRPMRIRVTDHLDDNTETVMRYSNMRIENTPNAWFQPSYLERL